MDKRKVDGAVDESLTEQVLMFYHLKTRRCVSTVHM